MIHSLLTFSTIAFVLIVAIDVTYAYNILKSFFRKNKVGEIRVIFKCECGSHKEAYFDNEIQESDTVYCNDCGRVHKASPPIIEMTRKYDII